MASPLIIVYLTRFLQRKSDAEIRSQRNALRALREEFADLEDAHSALSRQSAQTNATQKSEISTLTRQVARLQEQLTEMQQIADDRSRAFDQLQAQYDELNEAQDGSMTRVNGGDENWAIVRDELHRQASHLRSVEAANAKMTAELTIFRQRNASLEVLREQKRELERKLSGMDELKEQAVKLEAELDAARREREEWCAFVVYFFWYRANTISGAQGKCFIVSVPYPGLRHAKSCKPSPSVR